MSDLEMIKLGSVINRKFIFFTSLKKTIFCMSCYLLIYSIGVLRHTGSQ